VLAVHGSTFANHQTLLSGLTGAAIGRLLALPGPGLLAALATDRAVWAGQWQSGRRARPMRRLSGRSSWPQALAVAGLRGGRYTVTWSAAPAIAESASIVEVATGTARHSPRGARPAVTVPPAYAIDGVAAAPHRAGATLAWTESWFDSAGAYHSGVAVADLTRTLRPVTFEFPGQVAGGLALSAGPGGDQVLAVRACDPLGSCSVFVSTRRARGAFGQPQPLGAADASQEPVAAVGAGGAAVVGWVAQGQIFASGRRSASAPFSAPRVLSGVSDAADLTLALESGGQALAAWDQGAPSPSVMGALYGP
jgi:hypothetical protein